MTKEITQEERLDLKNLKEEWNVYYNNLLDRIKTVENKKVVIEKDVRDCILKANCDLMAENERLKKQLNDYDEKVLKDYADRSNWFVCYLRNHFIFKKDNYKANELAKETLKKWENK